MNQKSSPQRKESVEIGVFGVARVKQQADGALVLITAEPDTFHAIVKVRAVAQAFAETGFRLTKRSKKVCAWVSEPLPETTSRDDCEKRSEAIKHFLSQLADSAVVDKAKGAVARRRQKAASTPIQTGRMQDIVVTPAPGGIAIAPDDPEKAHPVLGRLLRQRGHWREQEQRWFVADADRPILKRALETYLRRAQPVTNAHESDSGLTVNPATGEAVLRIVGTGDSHAVMELRAQPGLKALTIRATSGKREVELAVPSESISESLAAFVLLARHVKVEGTMPPKPNEVAVKGAA